ncbi:Glycosyl transferases group 1 [Yersinia aldovae]|uniref:glycosyltransferase n=1 Tax=Yersinia aldovae TaxID=29483 RepID=UPI0005DEF3E0|nr:glycosyltransferase [Yersinia aldovae]CNH21926.1 Glycosyl transferases group 1 [Yersinia aldovae]
MKKMKWAIVSGDGLPTSGLLTIFRNVAEMAIKNGTIINDIPTDLGYSWRPDKKHFFPNGSPTSHYPSWMNVNSIKSAWQNDTDHENKLMDIKHKVAKYDSLSNSEIEDVKEDIIAVADFYESYFLNWFEENAIDWVFALNITISDAVPVSLALHRAAKKFWGNKSYGGIIFWDHDLFGSYGIYERKERLYPKVPNTLTPIPQENRYTKWIVASDILANETKNYPTKLIANMIPNILPSIDMLDFNETHSSFLTQHGIPAGSSIILVPVRVFRVKGIEIAINVFHTLLNIYKKKELNTPKLLIFGNMHEDPEYAHELKEQVKDFNLENDVIFLDEVPLKTYRNESNQWCLDEIDLLVICYALSGAILFTPSVENVESVGLGPALAAIAGLPCAVTQYSAFTEFYGDEYHHIKVTPERPTEAAQELFEWMRLHALGDAEIKMLLANNKLFVQSKFPKEPWQNFISKLQ